MTTRWFLDPVLAHGTTARLFGDLDSVFALEGEPIARDPLSRVIRIEVDGRHYYVKQYTGAGKNILRRWFGRPRVQAEWENLLAFRDWGIPTAKPVAYGLERGPGGFIRGALVTEEIAGSMDLARLARNDDPRLRDRRWIGRLTAEIAAIARTLHIHRFSHNDLKWRNLLVRDGDQPDVHLIDCPSGEYRRGPFLRYRIIKDLACLDKIAKYRLSRTQRLRFYLEYVGKSALDAGDKARIRRILRFFEGRE